MKIKLFVLLFIYSLCINGFSQEFKYNISGNLYDVSFLELINVIENQTNYSVYYDTAQIKKIVVNMMFSNMPVQKVIAKALDKTGLSFIIIEESIIVFKGDPVKVDFEFLKVSEDITKPLQNIESLNADENNIFSNKVEAEKIEKVIIGSKIGNSNKPVTITAHLKHKDTGEPLDGVTVYFEDTGKGAISDMGGSVSFNVFPGKYNVVFNHLGIQEKKVELDVRNSGIFSVELSSKLISIKEVTVVKSLNRRINGLNPGFEKMEYGELKEVPPMLGERDILKAVQMLPGVLNAGEGTTGLYIRGGSADQNHVYFNQIPVYNTSHLFGFFSSFNSEIINDLSMYKSHIPVNYGGRVSSILELNSKSGSRKQFKMRGGISPLTANVLAEIPVVKDKGSLIASYRTSYTDYLLSQIESPLYKNSRGGFYDVAVSGNYSTSESSFLKISFYNSRDNLKLGQINEFTYNNLGYSVLWDKIYSPTLKSNFSVSHSRYSYNEFSMENINFEFENSYAISHSEGKVQFLLTPTEKHAICIGLNTIFYKIERGDILPLKNSLLTPVQMQDEQAIESALYFSDLYRINDKLRVYMGLRYALYAHLGPQYVNKYKSGEPRILEAIEKTVYYSSFEPTKFYNGPELRLSANYKINDNNSLKISFDQNRQFVYMVTNTNAISPRDQWKLSDYNLKPSYGGQYSIGYYATVNYPSLSFSAELYSKKIQNILQYKDGAEFLKQSNIETEVLQGNQTAYGAEVLIKKDKGNLTGWFSYTYSRSLIKVDGNQYWNSINDGETYPSDYDKPHSLNVFTSLRANRRISLSSNLVYSTGRPITYPKGYYYVNNIPVFDYSARNSGRIPDYFRMDVALNFEGNLRRNKFIHSWWSLGVYNLTGRKNAYSVFFRSDENGFSGSKLSIIGVPIISVTWNFKLGNYEN